VRRRPLAVDLTASEYLARPILLDLYCGAGGAAYGYYLAGYRVIGIDTDPLMLKRYPFESLQFDALQVLDSLVQGAAIRLASGVVIRLDQIEAIHASPPCRAYSKTQRIRQNQHDALIAATRLMLQRAGKPYIIENVPDARHDLNDPVMLCGGMFVAWGLRVYRHRLFETSFTLPQRPHQPHLHKQAKMGRPPQPGEFIHVVGNFSNADYGRQAMGISWMGRDQLKEAIPPAYTQYIAHFIP
jgi:DNA (cytosine-5)-methyltransferase 1